MALRFGRGPAVSGLRRGSKHAHSAGRRSDGPSFQRRPPTEPAPGQSYRSRRSQRRAALRAYGGLHMSLNDQTTLRVVLYEGTGSQPLNDDSRFGAVSSLLEKGFAVTRANGQGQPVSNPRGPLLVLGQFSGGQAPLLEDHSQ